MCQQLSYHVFSIFICTELSSQTDRCLCLSEVQLSWKQEFSWIELQDVDETPCQVFECVD